MKPEFRLLKLNIQVKLSTVFGIVFGCVRRIVFVRLPLGVVCFTCFDAPLEGSLSTSTGHQGYAREGAAPGLGYPMRSTYSHPTVKRTPLPLARVPVFLWIA